MIPHHFGIYGAPVKTGFGLACIPELLEPYFKEDIPGFVREKTISRFGDDIEFSCDLILTNHSLIKDLEHENCFLFFVFQEDFFLDKNRLYWDEFANERNLNFIGWNIANYESGDYAFVDGYFPLVGRQVGPESYSISVDEPRAINRFGLIEDAGFLDFYIKKNKSLRYAYGEDEKFMASIDWRVYGVFCDFYTLKKLDSMLPSVWANQN